MLTLVNISKKYGNQTVVKNINLNMENGLYGVLAPNGAGKTTIIKMISTLLFPTTGEILYNGNNIMDMGAAYRDLIGYLPQHFGYYKNNTPTQYLEYLACLKNMPKQNVKRKIKELLKLVGLENVADKKMKKFSGGMIQRVGIAQAMLNDPKILILDEPTAGLDPKERVRFRNIISMLSKDRIVILSTHIVSDIESIANQVVLIKNHQIYKVDSVPNICNSLNGMIFEIEIPDQEYEDFEQTHQILGARQENGKMVVRYYEKEGEFLKNSVKCNANLEDVFLVTYQ